MLKIELVTNTTTLLWAAKGELYLYMLEETVKLLISSKCQSFVKASSITGMYENSNKVLVFHLFVFIIGIFLRSVNYETWALIEYRKWEKVSSSSLEYMHSSLMSTGYTLLWT